NKKVEYIAILELELFNTRAAVQEFTVIYNDQINPLDKRLQELRRLLYQVLENQKEPGEAQDEAEDFSEPEEEGFTYEDRKENGDNPDWRDFPKQTKAKNPKTEEKIRALFRELAKRFHPDLTSDEKEKTWREQVMQQVNQAYAQRDLKTLEGLAEQPDRPSKSKKQSRLEEINFLRFEIKRLDSVIADLKARIQHLENSPAWQLKMETRLQRKNGKDLITEKINEFQEKIDDLIEHLLVLGIDIEIIEGTDPQAEAEAPA
ncbi:MAG: J domain-containing protein, partial [Chloroflexota bacterium]